MTPIHLAERCAGHGPRVVCLHSSGGTSGQWQALIAAGQDRFTFIAPDFHGHGRSPVPADGAEYALATETDAIVHRLRGSGELHLVGHSYGACVALDIARRLPLQVRSLALYEPVLFGVLDPRSTQCIDVVAVGTAIVADARGGRLESAAQRFIDYWAGAGNWAAMPAPQQQAIAARIGIVASHFDALFANPIPIDAIAGFDLPVLLMRGGRSPASSSAVADVLAAALPTVRVLRFGAAGHLGPITDAADVNAAILAHLDEQQQTGLRAAA
jgi:pimeloyl-ACP methyl ester carboxylesterase